MQITQNMEYIDKLQLRADMNFSKVEQEKALKLRYKQSLRQINKEQTTILCYADNAVIFHEYKFGKYL